MRSPHWATRLLQSNFLVAAVYKMNNSYPVWYDDSFNDAWDAQVIETQHAPLILLQTHEQPTALQPAELPHCRYTRLQVISHTTEAICRETLARRRVHHLQVRPARQPRQHAATWTNRKSHHSNQTSSKASVIINTNNICANNQEHDTSWHLTCNTVIIKTMFSYRERIITKAVLVLPRLTVLYSCVLHKVSVMYTTINTELLDDASDKHHDVHTQVYTVRQEAHCELTDLWWISHEALSPGSRHLLLKLPLSLKENAADCWSPELPGHASSLKNAHAHKYT